MRRTASRQSSTTSLHAVQGGHLTPSWTVLGHPQTLQVDGAYPSPQAYLAYGSGLSSAPVVLGGSVQAPLTPVQQIVLSGSLNAPVAYPHPHQASTGSLRAVVSQSEPLRRSLAMQEERIQKLQAELQACRDSDAALRGENARLSDELARERELRSLAEARADGKDRLGVSASRASLGLRPPSKGLKEGGRTLQGSASRRVISPDGHSQGKDDVDARLHIFLEQGNCGIHFKRLNKGWYNFRRIEDAPSPQDRAVELSIINGKLMARLEASQHEPGWNKSKFGPIERFVAYFSSS